MTLAPAAPTRSPALVDLGAGLDSFRADVLAGLRRRPRRLPCKYFYDERGSRLFDRICELPEYYLTQVELGILRRHAGEIAGRLGPGALLIEMGSGSSVKTRLLLDHLEAPRGYVPVDISREHLHRAATALAKDYPDLAVSPVCVDFAGDAIIPLPDASSDARVVFFPGSSIGNFSPPEARRLLGRIAGLCGPAGRLLIGIDLKKNPKIIEAAYNDAAGVTADFNRNILRRINRELAGDFEVDAWHHHAFYEPAAGRVEMHLVSRGRQRVTVAEEVFEIKEGESIRTECSYKYTVEQFVKMAGGFDLEAEWTDEGRRFAVLLLVVSRPAGECAE